MGPTVMLAVWEPSLLSVMVTKLRKLKFEVDVAETEEDFKQQAVNGNVDVILLDIRTRGDNRLRLMSEVKEAKPGTEIILLSNQNCIALAMEGIQSGAFDDIQEPFEVDEISKKIRAAWKRRKKTRKNGRSRLAQFWEKTMMAAAYAEAGDFETALKLAGEKRKKKKTFE